MGTVNYPANHEHESSGVNSKRHGISSSTKQCRDGMRSIARSWLYCVGPELAF